MFEHMTEQEARASILESVSQYCEKFHTRKVKFGNYMELPPESERRVHPVSRIALTGTLRD